MPRPLLFILTYTLCAGPALAQQANAPAEQQKAMDNLLQGRFHWTATAPLIGPADRPGDPCYSVKDPTIVRYQDRWHIFCTIRSQKRARQIEYLSFADWKDAGKATRHVLQ